MNWRFDFTIFTILYDDVGHVKYKFKVGNKVRISKIKGKFDKGYLSHFSQEIFTISKTLARNPPMYKLKDFSGEKILGSFYSHQLQKLLRRMTYMKLKKFLRNMEKEKIQNIL